MLWSNTFNGGTNGVGITAANSGGASGSPFVAVSASAIFSSAAAHQGTLSCKMSSTAIDSYGRFVNADRDVAARFYVRFDVAHTADFGIYQPRVDTGSTSLYSVRLSPANRLRIANSVGTVWTAAADFPLSQWVRVEVLHHQGVAVNDGQVRIAYYLGDSTTAVEDSGWITSLDLRGDEGVAGQLYVGKYTGAAYSGLAYIDSIAVEAGTDYADFIGPYVVANNAPVANAGPDFSVIAASTVVMAGSATDPDGDALTYAWVFLWPTSGAPSLTGPTTLTPSFTAGPTGSIYALQLTVDDGTVTDTDIVNVAVQSAISDPTELVWNGAAWV